MEREDHFISIQFTLESPDDYKIYKREDALRELGYAFAKKYATERTVIKYMNTLTCNISVFEEEPDSRFWTFFCEEVIYKLEGDDMNELEKRESEERA